MANPATELTESLRAIVESERQEKIAALAFEFWLARAFRSGSPEPTGFGPTRRCGAERERHREGELRDCFWSSRGLLIQHHLTSSPSRRKQLSRLAWKHTVRHSTRGGMNRRSAPSIGSSVGTILGRNSTAPKPVAAATGCMRTGETRIKVPSRCWPFSCR